MTMQINIEEQLSFFLKINEELFHVENRWMQFFIWCNPDPVQIHASNIASGISVDDTIWVQHGYNLEYEGIAQHSCSQGWPQQIVDHSLHHEA